MTEFVIFDHSFIIAAAISTYLSYHLFQKYQQKKISISLWFFVLFTFSAIGYFLTWIGLLTAQAILSISSTGAEPFFSGRTRTRAGLWPIPHQTVHGSGSIRSHRHIMEESPHFSFSEACAGFMRLMILFCTPGMVKPTEDWIL